MDDDEYCEICEWLDALDPESMNWVEGKIPGSEEW